MNKESWYVAKSSEMDVIKILETDDWVVEYDKNRRMYRVSHFEDFHFKDEVWFNAYEDKETSLSETLKNLEMVECKYTDEELKEFLNKWNSIGCTSFCMNRD